MTPDDRRDALVAVYLDLARRHGRVPTTSEIARAAGVAEGTIYRAYPTKEALASDAVRAAFCPAPVRVEFMKIDPGQPMRDRLVDYTRILQQRFTSLFVLMGALGLTQPPADGDHTECIASGRHRRSDPPSAGCVPVHEQAVEPLRRLLVPDTDEITIPVGDLFQRLRLLTFSASHPGITDGRLLTPEEIVDTILDGVRRREPGSRAVDHPAGASTHHSTGDSLDHSPGASTGTSTGHSIGDSIGDSLDHSTGHSTADLPGHPTSQPTSHPGSHPPAHPDRVEQTV